MLINLRTNRVPVPFMGGKILARGVMTRFPDFQTMEFTMKTVDFSTGENKLDYCYTNF